MVKTLGSRTRAGELNVYSVQAGDSGEEAAPARLPDSWSLW